MRFLYFGTNPCVSDVGSATAFLRDGFGRVTNSLAGGRFSITNAFHALGQLAFRSDASGTTNSTSGSVM